MTLLLLGEGYTSAQVAGMGYGPSKYTVTAGNPYIGLSQVDFGPFLQDDWRVRPNLTVSFGLRWEGQTKFRISSDLRPRFGIAWSPGARSATGRPQEICNTGRLGIVLRSIRGSERVDSRPLQRVNQVNYSLYNPTIFDSSFSTPLPLSALTLENTQQKYE